MMEYKIYDQVALTECVCCGGRGPPETSCWLQPGHQSGGRIEGAAWGIETREEVAQQILNNASAQSYRAPDSNIPATGLHLLSLLFMHCIQKERLGTRHTIGLHSEFGN